MGKKIVRIQNDIVRRTLWVIWFPFEYVKLVHTYQLKKNFNLWVRVCFCLGWIGVKDEK